MNRIINLLLALSLLVSCGQESRKSRDTSDQKLIPVTVNEIISDAGPFIDQAVSIKGTVVHVCRHGGQRMFIIGEEGEDRVRITTGEDIAEFDIELEGETVEVTGIVKELIIDETYLAEWEAEIMEDSQHDRGEGHEGGVGHGNQHDGSSDEHLSGEANQDEEGEHAESDIEAKLAQIQKVRDEIAESGKDHLSDYWIETVSFKVTGD
jgi:hypothetical protein